MIFRIVVNGTFTEEKALARLDSVDAGVVLSGDFYHNKINEQIEGFLNGIQYCGIEYKMEDEIVVYPKDGMFSFCGFECDE